MLFQWNADRLAEQRLHRDIVEIARRAHEAKMNNRGEFFQSRFEQVFGFKPELGEPVTDIPYNGHSYWVQGFLFAAEHVSSPPSKLYVRTVSNGWAGVSEPETFYRLLERKWVVADD